MDNSYAVNQGMSILGYGVCIEDNDYATSLGYSDSSIDASILPPMIRRRTSLATKMAVSALDKACTQAGVTTEHPVIFVSCAGEMSVTNQLCQAIAAAQFPLSPTLFHNSVHNSAAGYWSMAVKSMAPMQSMAGLEDSFALGLLEAYCQLDNGVEHVLMVSYDESMPEYLLKDYLWQACAIALVLSPAMPGKPSLSRPYLSGKKSIREDNFSHNNPVSEGFSLLKLLQKESPEEQCVKISSGELPWLINYQSAI